MRRFLVTLALLLIRMPAFAATTVYTGSLVVPSGGTITMTGSGAGCVLVNGTAQQYVAACPTGTAAFSGTSPITITGSGPYFVNCTTCFTTAGGTVAGATTFSSTLSLLNAVASGYVSGASFEAGAHGASGVPIFQAASGSVQIGCDGSGQNCPVKFFTAGVGGSPLVTIDNLGDVTSVAQMTSTQFNISSKRIFKQDIQPLSFDALGVLHHVCWSSYRYRPGHGDPTETHIGFIADCAPSLLSGKKQDHYDIEAVATAASLAILQLEERMYIAIAILSLMILGLLAALIAVARAKRT